MSKGAYLIIEHTEALHVIDEIAEIDQIKVIIKKKQPLKLI